MHVKTQGKIVKTGKTQENSPKVECGHPVLICLKLKKSICENTQYLVQLNFYLSLTDQDTVGDGCTAQHKPLFSISTLMLSSKFICPNAKWAHFYFHQTKNKLFYWNRTYLCLFVAEQQLHYRQNYIYK